MSHIESPWNFPKHEYAQKDHGPTYCQECEAVHQNKRWSFDPARLKELKGEKLKPNLCPGCAMVAEELYEGKLALTWSRLSEPCVSKTDLLNLINNEAAKEYATNPLSRIVSIEEKGPEIEVLTTTEFLATHIGKAIKHAFHGHLTIDKPAREDLARVVWEGPE